MTRQRRNILLVSLLAVLTPVVAWVGCTGANPTVTQAQDGGTWNLFLGGTLNVQLPTSADESCRWRVLELNQAFLRRIDNPDSLAPGERSQLADGTFVETMRFQGLTPGKTTLRLDQVCNGTPSGETFTLTVFILGSGI